ncbi:hypothetical protein DPMN_132237 [Dreissena polymorpha]|uniref:Uncharacterized protein n=1 Tax=Dreissena polymorpha TaxID=45954 RepID=A0A9D4FS48_DREPO|nr:hypothetical protein DPMN_132237 [Dreissena polymorpha]
MGRLPYQSDQEQRCPLQSNVRFRGLISGYGSSFPDSADAQAGVELLLPHMAGDPFPHYACKLG